MLVSRNQRSFRTIREMDRPWETVVDGAGFPDPWVNPYVTFLAWQDVPPAQVRRQAAILADAATWLAEDARTWPETPLSEWAWYAMLWPVPTHRSLEARIETLHHFYAFWHWHDPRRVPVQPFPATQQERREWLTLVLAGNPTPYPCP